MNGILSTIMYQSGYLHIDKQYMLDPLSTIIKLAILSYKNMPKIAIRYNGLCIHEESFYQPIIRYLYGDGREVLQYLQTPIILACNHYLDVYHDTTRNIYDCDISLIFSLAIKGLHKLKQTYQSNGLILHCLEHYELIIQSHLDQNDIKASFIITTKSNDYPENILETLFGYWNCDNIKMIVGLFQTLEKHNDHSLIKMIEIFMISVDENVYHIISNSAT